MQRSIIPRRGHHTLISETPFGLTCTAGLDLSSRGAWEPSQALDFNDRRLHAHCGEGRIHSRFVVFSVSRCCCRRWCGGSVGVVIEGAHGAAVVVDPPEWDIDYPEGELVPEAVQHSRRRSEVVTALRHWLEDRRQAHRAWVCDNLGIYYREGDPAAMVAPDVAVAFGVNAAALETARSYRVWEAGAAPVWVLEIASPSTHRGDESDKPATYAALGAQEYWRLDPTGGDLFDPPLRGERLTAGRWAPIAVTADDTGALRGTSTALGLDLCWQHPKLRLYDPTTDAWLLDHDDRRDAHLAAQTRAEREATARRAAEAELAALRLRLDPQP